jgi:hypothetical protein
MFRGRRGRNSGLGLLLGVAVVAVVALLVSPVGSATTQAAPANTAPPAISLTASGGTWSGSPTSFTYQWQRCDSAGINCNPITGATTSSYGPGAGDAGQTLRAQVTAGNADGKTTATSQAAAVDAPAGPPNTVPPTITGTADVGSTLTANPGTWIGSSITFAYQWQRCDAAGINCSEIASATNTTYAVVSDDLAHTLRVAVTATDANGSHPITSGQTATVTSGPAPPPTGCPANKSAGPIQVADVSPPAHLLIDGQSSRPAVIGGSTQTVVLRFHISACGGRSVIGALVYQTATPYQQFSESEVPTGPDGWATLTLHRLRFFPASPRQGLLVVFVRARKPGEDLLGGISARRLVSFRVNLRS